MPILRRVDPGHLDAATIRQAADLLLSGNLVIVPTDTVYGIAADPRMPGALDRLFEAKQRPPEKAIPLLIGSVDALEECGAEMGPAAEALAARFWPGPLTLVVPIRGGRLQGFRFPSHAVAAAVLRAVGVPLAVTSANRSGHPPACTAEEAVRAVGDHVALALDAGRSPGGAASSVVRVVGDDVEILREGAVSASDLYAALSILD